MYETISGRVGASLDDWQPIKPKKIMDKSEVRNISESYNILVRCYPHFTSLSRKKHEWLKNQMIPYQNLNNIKSPGNHKA